MNHPADRWVDLGGIRLHLREWVPDKEEPIAHPFVLLHGLSSNAATWDLVAGALSAEGHPVFAVDQRGHGLSDKPEGGYDFVTVSADLFTLIDRLDLKNVVLAGQSWGGNVLLEFAARYPGRAAGYVFVDGGFLNLRQRGTWENVSQELRPPDIAGTPSAVIKERIASMHPHWSPEAVALTLKNLELLPDGTVRPWLRLDRHMAILKALHNQEVLRLFARVREPVLICAAADGSEWDLRKRDQVAVAAELIPRAEVRWFQQTAHDIHLDRPQDLAAAMLDFADGLETS